jgi:hypothetical protein
MKRIFENEDVPKLGTDSDSYTFTTSVSAGSDPEVEFPDPDTHAHTTPWVAIPRLADATVTNDLDVAVEFTIRRVLPGGQPHEVGGQFYRRHISQQFRLSVPANSSGTVAPLSGAGFWWRVVATPESPPSADGDLSVTFDNPRAPDGG